MIGSQMSCHNIKSQNPACRYTSLSDITEKHSPILKWIWKQPPGFNFISSTYIFFSAEWLSNYVIIWGNNKQNTFLSERGGLIQISSWLSPCSSPGSCFKCDLLKVENVLQLSSGSVAGLEIKEHELGHINENAVRVTWLSPAVIFDTDEMTGVHEWHHWNFRFSSLTHWMNS